MRSLPLIALLLAPLTLDAQAPAAIDSVPCLTDWRVVHTRDRIVEFMVRDDSVSILTRGFWRLPLTNPDSIVVVIDPAVCSRIAAAYYQDATGLLPEYGIGVVRVGAYMVALGAIHAGEWAIVNVYDPRMRVVARMAR